MQCHKALVTLISDSMTNLNTHIIYGKFDCSIFLLYKNIKSCPPENLTPANNCSILFSIRITDCNNNVTFSNGGYLCLRKWQLSMHFYSFIPLIHVMHRKSV